MDKQIKSKFKKEYGYEPQYCFSCGGRFEVLGNHTDHNHGLCLAATCDLEITAAVVKRNDLRINLISENYKGFSINLGSLTIEEVEKGSSASLVRGIASYLKERGYKIGGFDFYSSSTIFEGAGVSSSAAFELIIAEIFNYLFNEDKIEKMVLCKAGQYAENIYFGKKSGLLDQIGVGYGGLVYIDFENIEKPLVKTTQFPFKDLEFVIVNTGGSHAHLSHLYSQIPLDMKRVSEVLGVEFLRESNLEKLEQNRDKLSEIEYKRALHFYGENERVKQAMDAIKYQDKKGFLDAINGSRKSSTELLKNMMVEDQYEGSPLEACDIAIHILKDKGAIKINGGGFQGSCIACVDKSILKEFIEKMAHKYGKQNVSVVSIRKTGPTIL